MSLFLGRARGARSFALGALALAAAGCSMHPLPEDFSRASTVDIVRSIRCEARAGVLSFSGSEWSRAEPIIKATTIGYDYVFDMEEKNAAAGVGPPDNGFLKAVNGKSTLDATASAALDRRNQRRFKIIEKLTDLLTPDAVESCVASASRKNWVHPIAGKIGLDEVVRTYIRLEMLTELQKRELKDAKGKTIIPFPTRKNIVFSDDISFTTHLEAGVSGTLVLDAVVGHVSVTNASVAVGASRTDMHSVIVAMTRDKVDVKERAAFAAYRASKTPPRVSAATALSNGKMVRAELLKNGAVRDPRSQATLIQIDEDGPTRVAMELERRRSLNDQDNEAVTTLGQRFLDVLKVP